MNEPDHPLMLEFQSRFRAGRYFEAHEILEELWIMNGRPSPGILRGLVQLAVACEHHRRGRPLGARGVFQRARDNLTRPEPAGSGVPAGPPLRAEGLRRYERVLMEDRPEPLPPPLFFPG